MQLLQHHVPLALCGSTTANSLHSVAGKHGGHAIFGAALIPLGQLEAVVERQRRIGSQVVKGQSLSGIDLQRFGVQRGSNSEQLPEAAAARQLPQDASLTQTFQVVPISRGRYMTTLTL